MTFNELATWLERLEKESSRLTMTKDLAQLFAQLSADEASIVAYFCTGVLQPPYKNLVTNIAEKMAIKAVAQAIDHQPEFVQKHLKDVTDLGQFVGEQGRWESHHRATINHVYDELNAIALTGGIGSQEAKIDALVRLIKSVEPQSAKFIVRIVLGTLRLGFSDMTIIDALSWLLVGNKSLSDDIEAAYSTCADIGLIAQTVKDAGIEGIKKMHVRIGIPVRPAAAERLPSAQEIIDKLGPCVAEPKLDGFRLQIHVDKRGEHPIIHFFSRNLTDMSSMYPDLVYALAPLNVDTLIMEGEAVAFDPDTGSFMPFQETVKRKRKHDIHEVAQQLPLQLFLFDVLYYNGKPVLDLPLAKRRELLVHVCAQSSIDHTIIRVDNQVPIHTAAELEQYFLEQVNAGLEGVVVKRPDSIYQPGKRNFNWIKLKRLERGHLLDSIDCVVVGYYHGSGKRAGFGIGAILVAVYNKSCDCFQTIAKIGTGFSDVEWVEIRKKCDALVSAQQPVNVACNKNLYPDVWVNPSIVIEVTADEITESPVHTAAQTQGHSGLALRFPRFVRYREDKTASEATDVDEVLSLFKKQKRN